METKKILLYGGIGLGALLLLSYFSKKRKEAQNQAQKEAIRKRQEAQRKAAIEKANQQLIAEELKNYADIRQQTALAQREELMQVLDENKIAAQRLELAKQQLSEFGGLRGALNLLAPEARVVEASLDDYLRYAKQSQLAG
jgi:hypothetical protein